MKAALKEELAARDALRVTVNGVRLDLTSLKRAGSKGEHCFPFTPEYQIPRGVAQEFLIVIPKFFIGGYYRIVLKDSRGNLVLHKKFKVTQNREQRTIVF
eukprot:Pgem_evm1s17698